MWVHIKIYKIKLIRNLKTGQQNLKFTLSSCSSYRYSGDTVEDGPQLAHQLAATRLPGTFYLLDRAS